MRRFSYFFCIYCIFLVPATISESEKNYTVKMNNDITMDCQAEGDQPIPVGWSFGGRALNVHNDPRHKVKQGYEPTFLFRLEKKTGHTRGYENEVSHLAWETRHFGFLILRQCVV